MPFILIYLIIGFIWSQGAAKYANEEPEFWLMLIWTLFWLPLGTLALIIALVQAIFNIGE